MPKITIACATALVLLSQPTAAQMIAKPPVARPAPVTDAPTKPIGKKGGAAIGRALSAKVATVTVTITQPANNGDTLRVSTGGDYARCGFLPGTPVPSQPTGALGAAAGAAIPGVQNICTLTLPKGGTIPLRIIYDKYSLVPAAGNGWQLAAGQWAGDCLGTAGDTCMIDLSQDRAIRIDTSAVGGVERPMGQTDDED